MATDVTLQFKAEVRQAQQSIQGLRGQIAQLNKTLAEQRTQLLTADAAEQKKIRTEIAANVALKATLRSRIEVLNLQKQSIVQTQREAQATEQAAARQARAQQQKAKATERAAQEQIRAQQRMSVSQQALVQELTMGVRVIYQQLAQLTSGFVRAAADMETFRNTINVVTQDADETNRILAQLLQLTVDLVGIDTRDLISYAGRLMATGLSAEEAQTAIAGVTKRVAEQGKSAYTTRRVLEQFTQAINANHISYQDFRPILRELPTLYRDASAALGVNIRSLDDFRRATASVGGPTQAIILLLEEMERSSEGANLDTFNAQIDILRDQARLLAAELGEHLVPAIVAVLKQVNGWIEAFRNMADPLQAIIAWSVALATAVAGLATVLGTVTLAFGALSAALGAVTGASGFAAVTAGIGGVVAAFSGLAPFLAVGGVILGGIALLTKAIHDTSEAAQVLKVEITALEQVMQVYNLTTGQLETLTAAQQKSYEKFSENVQKTQTEIGTLNQKLAENAAAQERVNESLAKTSSYDAYLVLQRDLQNLKLEQEGYVSDLEKAEAALANLKFEVPTDAAAVSIESLEEQLVRAVDEVLRLRDAFGEVSRSGDIAAIQQAGSELTASLKRELELQLKDTELTAAEKLELELSHARDVENVNRDVAQRIAKIIKDAAKAREKADADAAKASQAAAAARIKDAERVRALEVKEFERAAQSGKAYADQLRELTTLGARREFHELVQQFQEQGLSLEAAREKAGRYIDILNAVNLNSAEQEFGNFNSEVKRGTDESADAVYNLIRGVRALGAAIANALPDTAGSLERSLLNEQRYFEQNPIGRTLDDIQSEAGEQGRKYVLKLFAEQDRAAARQQAQTFNELTNATLDVTTAFFNLSESTNLADRAFVEGLEGFGRLATGDLIGGLTDLITSTIGISQEAAADREQKARDREARNAASLEDFTTFQRNFSRIAKILEIPDIDIDALGEDFYFKPIAKFEEVLSASTADFSEGIKNALLAGVVNVEQEWRDGISVDTALTADAISEILSAAILPALEEHLDASQFDLAFERSLGNDLQAAYQALIEDTTNFYQAQLDIVNIVRQATGDLSFGDTEALANQLAAQTNQLRLQLAPDAASDRYNLRQRIGQRQQEGSTEAIARDMYGAAAYDAEVAAAEIAKRNAELRIESDAAFRSGLEFVGGLKESFTQFGTVIDELNAVEFIASPQPERVQAILAAMQERTSETFGPPQQSQDEILARNIAVRQQQLAFFDQQEQDRQRLFTEMNANLDRQLEGLLTSVLDANTRALFEFSGQSASELFGLENAARLSPEQIASSVAEQLSTVIQEIQSGDALGAEGSAANELALALQEASQLELQGFEGIREGLTTQTESFAIETQALSVHVQNIPTLLTPPLQEITQTLNTVVQAVNALANQPIHVNVDMNTGNQVINVISDALAERGASGQNFR